MSDAPVIPHHHRLFLVRHAASAPVPEQPAHEWQLGEEGRAGARRLAALGMFDLAQGFYAGDEPKMVQTLEPAAAGRERRVQAETAFRETGSAGWVGDRAVFEDTVRRLFADLETPPAPGWETGADALARFTAGVERLRGVHQPDVNRDRVLPGMVAIATGGRMLTLYLAQVLGWAPEEAFTRWRALRMPDVAVLELDEGGAGRLVIPARTLVV